MNITTQISPLAQSTRIKQIDKNRKLDETILSVLYILDTLIQIANRRVVGDRCCWNKTRHNC